MNTLSWLIYLAGVSGALGALAFFVGIVCGVTFCIWPLRNMWLEDFRRGQGISPAPKKLIAFALLGLALSALTPSRETVYAIAASEIGEEVVKSNTAGKAMQALDAWLDRQIAEQSGGAK